MHHNDVSGLLIKRCLFFSISAQATGGTPSSFTSFGLTGDLWFKPQISGIGAEVYSTLSPFAAEQQSLTRPYGLSSGTSMACPYTVGYVYSCLLKEDLTVT